MSKNADWIALLRETVAMMSTTSFERKEKRPELKPFRAEWRKELDCKSSDDGSCPIGNRQCDRGWQSWRLNGRMWASRCKCGRANWGQGPT